MILETISTGTLDSLVESLRSLPWAAHALALGSLFVGLVLWAAGRRVLRPLICLLGAVTGAGAGFFLLPTLGWDRMGGIPTPFLGLFTGGIAGALAGIILYRLTVGLSLAMVACGAGILVSSSALRLSPQAREATKAAYAAMQQPPSEGESEAPGAAKPVVTEEASRKVQAFLDALWMEVRTRFASLPERSRLIVILSGLAGLGIGFLVGMAMPMRSAAVVTSALGSSIWIPSGIWMANVLELPGRGLLEMSSAAWLTVWVGVTGVGFVVQVAGTGSPKQRAKRSERSPEEGTGE